MNKNLKIIKVFNNALVHYCSEDGLLFSRFNKLFIIENLDELQNIRYIGEIPNSFYTFAGRIRLLSRFFKLSILHVCSVNDFGYLVFGYGSWWFLKKGKRIAEKLSLPILGRPMMHSTCIGDDGNIYLAEYRPNRQRDSVKILRINPETYDYELAFAFPPKTIRHVHALIKDPFNNGKIWILTGDYDEESVFFYTDDFFSSVNALPCLGQKTRATSFQFLNKDVLLWGMDSPLCTSYILKWGPDFDNEPEIENVLPGPAYYSMSNSAGGIYFGTTVESGPAVKTNFATIWGANLANHWNQLASFKSDILPQHTIIFFPKGEIQKDFVVFSLRGTTELDGCMIIARDLSLASNE